VASPVALHVSPDAATAIASAASSIRGHLARAVAERGAAHLALSGGGTGAQLARTLASQPIAWSAVEVWQVDERIAADGDDARNATALVRELVTDGPVRRAAVHLMPVTASDPDGAAGRYARTLPRFDVVHLGLGADGHTASWPPDQPAARTAEAAVTITGPFNGHRRMTLTAGPIAAARTVVWVVCGADKREVLRRVLAGDRALPATHALDHRSVIFADAAAAG
jgi:6-phosphogluconolactonase